MSDAIEKQTCPRRMGEMGPWEYAEGLDEWRRDRWTADRAAAEREAADYEAAHPGSTAAPHDWRGPGGLPRTCSFCGGIHPEDCIALIGQGWETERTDKRYKLYLHPPGTMAAYRDPAATLAGPSAWSPTPPVKVYLQHFTPDQCDRANKAMADRKARSPEG